MVRCLKKLAPYFTTIVFAGLIAFGCGPCAAHEVVSLTDDLRILRDFSNITIAGPDVKAAHVFVDIDRFIVPGLPPVENAKLQQIATNGIASQLHLINSKEQANYLVQIRMGQYVNYALRNPQGKPSLGYVMISLCRFPLNESNCENLQYDYFKPYAPLDIFSWVLGLWLRTTVKSNP